MTIRNLNNSPTGLTRRSALAVTGGALTAGALSRATSAQGAVTLRWWSPQSVPAQLAAYKLQIETFEAANPGIKVVFEPTSDETYAAQLAAAFASGQVPNIVTHLPSFAVGNYWRSGLLEPFNDVIQMVGPEKFYPGANRIYEVEPGVFAGAGIGGTAANSLWLRTDLMKKAGIAEAPKTWDELRTAARKMQGGGIYGAPLPYARNSMTTLIFICFIHLAGGQVFTPDLQVAIDSPETLNALEFYKSMRELCPPGATSYSWGESLTAFVSGATATGIYTGRVLANVNAQNPSIKDSITCTTYPSISASVPSWTFNDFPSMFIPKAAKDMGATKKFAAHIYAPEGYIKQLHAAPGHVLPVLKTIADDPKYQDNPIIAKYANEVKIMAAASAGGFNLGFESAKHKPNAKAGEVVNSAVIAEMVQRVCLNNEDPKKIVGETAQRIEKIVKG
ncbi:ABC transporter substrate-binding protein [Reyranella sp. CPCC 100927]|uniref:ABC transporter substrate-binding protein n=1 Tax=Reyranella sp. CPCC 100927 TaxID=2599616 RepID=UPI0011B3E63E|nr:ABC transporter substrate-binding protein [Reyranella sp. CPCC 100927]TWT12949.1 carbohydrate ABC transporter substrate-binding protein [Reyranella sp. CPCC 100927]